MTIDNMPISLTEVPIEVKISDDTAILLIDHVNLFREKTKIQISEFALLADVLGRLSAEGHASLSNSTVLEWRFNLADLSHVKFVIDRYASCARWYKVVWK